VKTCAIRYHPFQVCYDHTHGDAPNRPPANETFWVKSSSGSGNVSLDWKPRAGSGRAVVVNADDSRGVTADRTRVARPCKTRPNAVTRDTRKPARQRRNPRESTPPHVHGKEGVDGSSPSEGLKNPLQISGFFMLPVADSGDARSHRVTRGRFTA